MEGLQEKPPVESTAGSPEGETLPSTALTSPEAGGSTSTPLPAASLANLKKRKISDFFKKQDASSLEASSISGSTSSSSLPSKLTGQDKTLAAKVDMVCLDCYKPFSRPRQFYLTRHAKEKHKNDLNYDVKKSIVSIESPLIPLGVKRKILSGFSSREKRLKSAASTSSAAENSKDKTESSFSLEDTTDSPLPVAASASDDINVVLALPSPSSPGSPVSSFFEQAIPMETFDQVVTVKSEPSIPDVTLCSPPALTETVVESESSELVSQDKERNSNPKVIVDTFVSRHVRTDHEGVQPKELPGTEGHPSYSEIYSVLQKLEMKIDNIAAGTAAGIQSSRGGSSMTLPLPTSTYLMDAETTRQLHQATTMDAVTAVSPIILEPSGQDSTRVYCSLCRTTYGIGGRTSHGKVVKSSGRFCAGFIVSNSSLDTETGKRAFYDLKQEVIKHLEGVSASGNAHLDAAIGSKKKKEEEAANITAFRNIVCSGLTTIKMGAAGIQHETCLALLACAGADIGTINHSRKQLKSIVDASIGHCRLRLHGFLTTKLPSTGFCPHFSLACDKSTPGRTSNHAVMLLAPFKGTRQAYPIANHSDGQYQSSAFKEALREACSDANVDFPVIWDAGHWLDLAVKAMRDKSAASPFFKKFLERANSFSDMFARGRGHEEYLATKEHTQIEGSNVSSFSVTRFSSSSYDSLLSIYKSYPALVTAYAEHRETNSDNDEMKFKVRGWDFALELCIILDIMTPITVVMLKSQAVKQNVWNIEEWMAALMEELSNIHQCLTQLNRTEDLHNLPDRLFPRTAKHAADFVSQQFCGMRTYEGWLVSPDASSKNGVKWTAMEFTDVITELVRMTEILRENLEKRKTKCTNSMATLLNSCLNPLHIISKVCGERKSPTDRPRLITGKHQNMYRTDGRVAFEEFYSYVCQLPHVLERQEREGLLFETTLASEVYSQYTGSIYDTIWDEGRLLQEWFPDLPQKSSRLVRLGKLDEDSFLATPSFKFTYSDGDVHKSIFSEENFFKTFYCDEEFYRKNGQELSTAVDVAVSMGGCEAVVEGFYSVMKRHLSAGGMGNDMLVDRAILDWLLPLPIRCPKTIDQITDLFVNGHDKIKLRAHSRAKHSDPRNRGKFKEVSKVLTRILREPIQHELFVEEVDVENVTLK